MYLGLDLGTSGVKALLIDARPGDRRVRQCARSTCRGRIPAGRSRTLRIGSRRPKKRSASSSARTASELAAVKGIGLSGHMHGATLIDA